LQYYTGCQTSEWAPNGQFSSSQEEFQSVGTFYIIIMARGTHITSLNSLRTAGGQPSGPGDLSTLSDFNFSNTDCGDISISEMSDEEFVKVKDGRDVVSSEMKTLEKNLPNA